MMVGQPRWFDDRGGVWPQVGAGYEQESALADLDGAAAAVGERQPAAGPADLRVELAEDTPQAVPGQGAGAFFDVPVEQGAEADPKRCYQAGPSLVQPGGELVSCARRIGEQRGDQVAVPLVVHGVPAGRELPRHLRRAGGADFRQLGADPRPGVRGGGTRKSGT
jgi:hypothetical protein